MDSPSFLRSARPHLSTLSSPDAYSMSVACYSPLQLMIQPFDKGAVKDIERAIQMSDLGINPSNDGNLIRLNIPPLTQARVHDSGTESAKWRVGPSGSP